MSERVDGKGVVPARVKNTVNKECNAATYGEGGGGALSVKFYSQFVNSPFFAPFHQNFLMA